MKLYISLFYPESSKTLQNLLGNNSCDIVIILEHMSQQNTKRLLKNKKKRRIFKNMSMLDTIRHNVLIAELENELLNLVPMEKDCILLSSDEEVNTNLLKNKKQDINNLLHNKEENSNGPVHLIDLSSESSSIEEVKDENNISEPSGLLLDYVFNELTKSIPDDIQSECDQEAHSSDKFMKDNIKNRASAEIKVVKDAEIKKNINNDANIDWRKNTVNINKDKIIKYSKILQQKLNKIINIIENDSTKINENVIMDVKLMTSSMLKTGLKVQKILGISRQQSTYTDIQKNHNTLINPKPYYDCDMQQNVIFINPINSISRYDCNLERIPMDISPTHST